jgi:hypothetical protein
MDISKQTSILSDDVVSALQHLGLLKYLFNSYALVVPPDLLADLAKRHHAAGPAAGPAAGLAPVGAAGGGGRDLPKADLREPLVDPDKLHWAPLVGHFVGKDKWSIKAKVRASKGLAPAA